MSGERQPHVAKLKGEIGRFQLFALGFGSIIGSAWVVILNQWLSAGGPGGAVLGFVAGGIVVLAIGACYAELTTRIPATGGEFVFALRVYGRGTAFFVGWFTALAWICVTIFEGLALAWFLDILFPALQDVTLYRAFDAPVTRNQLLFGAMGGVVITAVNYLGGSMAARLQSIFTYGFLIVALAILVLMPVNGRAEHLQPLFPQGGASPWWLGAATVFASCAFLLNGFQGVIQAVEERSARLELRSVANIVMVSIAAAALFYCLVVLATASSVSWTTLAGSDLATVAATRVLPWGEYLAPAILVAAAASLIKTWNGVFLMSARILLALARHGLLPAWAARVDARTGAPTRAVLVVGTFNVVGLLLGRGAIGPVVDMASISLVVCLVLCSVAVPVLRRQDPTPAPYRVPGGPWIIGLAIAGSCIMAAVALATPVIRHDGLPLEHLLLGAWAAAGLVLWFFIGRHRSVQS